MIKIIINVDVDGILRNIVPNMLQVYIEQYDNQFKVKEKDYIGVEETMPLIKDIKAYFVDNAQYIFGLSKPYEGAIDFMNILREEHHKIQIVTNQIPPSEKFTLDWLHDYKVPYDSVHFARDKSVVKGDFLIDDYKRNLEACVHETIGIAIDRPWNQEWSGFRANNYNDVLNIIDYLK